MARSERYVRSLAYIKRERQKETLFGRGLPDLPAFYGSYARFIGRPSANPSYKIRPTEAEAAQTVRPSVQRPVHPVSEGGAPESKKRARAPYIQRQDDRRAPIRVTF